MTRIEIQGAKKIPGAKIACWTADGREFVLKHTFPHRDSPQLYEALGKVRQHLSIDPKFWREPRRGEI